MHRNLSRNRISAAARALARTPRRDLSRYYCRRPEREKIDSSSPRLTKDNQRFFIATRFAGFTDGGGISYRERDLDKYAQAEQE